MFKTGFYKFLLEYFIKKVLNLITIFLSEINQAYLLNILCLKNF